ncbi:MAG: response regulator transcription factor [Bacteroidales bacterium]|nr:response regulator transcription factor [Bacteroidales bacterium]MBK7172790.1 response regulator transcription factor [Bacteroidales bacterium]
MERIKIILADDHQLVRTGIANLLNGESFFEIIGEASDATECLQLIEQALPDVAILDIAMPGLSGIELTRKIRFQYPSVQVLILSMYTSEEFIFNAINAGAKGYLPKNTSRKELIDAIRAINQGSEYYAESISNVILKSYIKKAKSGPEDDNNKENQLSKRELEVLRLFAEGFSNQEIADKLFISIRTVESHKNHIMQRLELKSSVDLVKFAIRNNMVNL